MRPQVGPVGAGASRFAKLACPYSSTGRGFFQPQRRATETKRERLGKVITHPARADPKPTTPAWG